MKTWIAATATVLLAAAAMACEVEQEAPGPAPELTAQSTPGLNVPVEVGNLELTVVGVDTYDAAGEDANYRVRLRLRKLGGDTYDFTDSVLDHSATPPYVPTLLPLIRVVRYAINGPCRAG